MKMIRWRGWALLGLAGWCACAGGQRRDTTTGATTASRADARRPPSRIISPDRAARENAQKAVLLALRRDAELSNGMFDPTLQVQDAAERPAGPWELWRAYVARFVSPDGRIIDHTDGQRSTSEGQSYALFFALVANDRPRFDQILHWTEQNLARGNLREHLPAWKWGRDSNGRWGVLDRNAASDADLWLAYALHEAGRLWGSSKYQRLSRTLIERVLRFEVRALPGLGAMLLPGPKGFVLDNGATWRLNPSYLPLQLLRRFASAGFPGPWSELLDNTVRLLQQSATERFVGDWVVWRRAGGFGVDPETGPIGGYDAIRVYLWAAMLPPDDPHRSALLKQLDGPYILFRERQQIAERVNTRAGRPLAGQAPPGFAAVLLAQAHARGDRETVQQLRDVLARSEADGLYGTPPAYYDQNLALFSEGFVSGRYRFELDGGLDVAWSGTP
jgi:endo-1,4-beta-D-glucanase Y